MAELEKVIVGIEHCDRLGCSMCPYKPGGYTPMDCRIQLMRDALEPLKEYQEKQEALLPVWQDRAQELVCQKCGGIVWQEDNYCSKCGQAVKWE